MFFRLYTSSLLLSSFISLLCDYCIAGKLTWSLIVLISLLFFWSLTVPLRNLSLFRKEKHMADHKKMIHSILRILSAGCFPYLFLLSLLLRVPAVFTAGSVFAAAGLCGVWGVYMIFAKQKSRLNASALACLLMIPLQWAVSGISFLFFPSSGMDFFSNMFSSFFMAFLASALFLFGSSGKKWKACA